jgi:hypothetical protein
MRTTNRESFMLRLRWTARLVGDVILMGVVNRSPALSLAILFLMTMGLLAIGAQVSAPFIYTLF